MKTIILFLIVFGLTGCYTVLWLPSDEMPKSYSQNEFYNSQFYGEYYDYYSTPWWVLNPINVYNPSKNISTKIERDKKTSNVRNESGERIIIERGNSGRNEYTPPVTTVNGNNQGTNGSGSQTNTNKGSETNNTNEEQNRTKSNSNNDNSSLRNESGNRNSGNSRR